MNPRTFSVFIVSALVLIAAATILWYRNYTETQIRESEAVGSPLVPGLDISQVRQIVIKTQGALTTLSCNDAGDWCVRERNDYPADASLIAHYLMRISEAKIGETVPCPKSGLSKLLLTEPVPPSLPDTTPIDALSVTSLMPTSLEFFDKEGNRMAPPLICGKIRLPEDNSNINRLETPGRFYYCAEKSEKTNYALFSSESLDELPYAPQNFLDKSPINIKDILHIAYAPTQSSNEAPGWSFKRSSADTEMRYIEQMPGETIKDNFLKTIASSFSQFQFTDVAKVEEPDPTSPLAILSVSNADSALTIRIYSVDDTYAWCSVELKNIKDSSFQNPYAHWRYRINIRALLMVNNRKWIKPAPPSSVFTDTAPTHAMFNLRHSFICAGEKI